MVNVIRHADAIADESGHAGESTQFRREPGAPEQDPPEAFLGPGIQLEQVAGSGLRTQAILTGFSVDPVPSSNTAPVDANLARHIEGLMAPQEKSDHTNSTPIQFSGLPEGRMACLRPRAKDVRHACLNGCLGYIPQH